ncbi:DNA repair protein RecO [Halothiobacillus sp. DCM-1]|uniref:DNA repair protein RecO n=1 Tax=Halothiobacillus sp. DCM-1 TaxID=3112558 RepID=UPI003255BA2E
MELSRAYVLHSRPWRETSLLVDWFTEDWGRVTTCQRGIRRSHKGAAGRPTPFSPLQIGLSGRGGMPVACPIEPASPAAGLAGCWLRGQALAVGFYLNELLLRAVQPQEPLPRLFAAYEEALLALCIRQEPFEVLLRRFERRLLDELGVGFDWQQTVDTGLAVHPEQTYRVHPEWGIAAETAQGMPVAGRVLCALAANQPQQHADDRRAAQALLQMLLAPLIGAAPFHSRRLWRSSAE